MRECHKFTQMLAAIITTDGHAEPREWAALHICAHLIHVGAILPHLTTKYRWHWAASQGRSHIGESSGLFPVWWHGEYHTRLLFVTDIYYTRLHVTQEHCIYYYILYSGLNVLSAARRICCHTHTSLPPISFQGDFMFHAHSAISFAFKKIMFRSPDILPSPAFGIRRASSPSWVLQPRVT